MLHLVYESTPPNKRLKLTGHRALQISVLPSGHEIKRFQLPGHLGRQLSREPLGGTSSISVAVLRWSGEQISTLSNHRPGSSTAFAQSASP
jgi:hypothetical protein